MFHPLPIPLLPSGVNLTKLAPGLVWFFFFLKTHSLHNRQKTGIKGYPEPRIWFPRVETNICFRANSTRPKTFLAALWAPKRCSVGEITGNRIVSPFQPSAVASGVQHQHCQSMEMPSRGFFYFFPRCFSPSDFSEPSFRGSRSKRDDCRRLLVTGHH